LRQQALGPARFDAELSAFFDRDLFDMTNEPDIHTPFLFAITDQPARTDELVARLRDRPIDHWYENHRKYSRPIRQASFSPQGFAEGMDDDGGAMSAWYVWASIGIYPLVPGKPSYVLTRPAVRRIVLHFARDRVLTITTQGSIGDRCHVERSETAQSARILSHSELIQGGRLNYLTRC